MSSSLTADSIYQSQPPSYMESEAQASGVGGFPMGYFMLRSRASNRVLDVETDSREDGAEVILWPSGETSHVITMRDPSKDNQVFFIDTEGALCSKASGTAHGCALGLTKPRIQDTPSTWKASKGIYARSSID